MGALQSGQGGLALLVVQLRLEWGEVESTALQRGWRLAELWAL